MMLPNDVVQGVAPMRFPSPPTQGMILGEVEYTRWRDASGNPAEEGAPGATSERVPDAVGAPAKSCVQRNSVTPLMHQKNCGKNQKNIFERA